MSGHVIRVPRLPTPFLLVGTIDHTRANPFVMIEVYKGQTVGPSA